VRETDTMTEALDDLPGAQLGHQRLVVPPLLVDAGDYGLHLRGYIDDVIIREPCRMVHVEHAAILCLRDSDSRHFCS